MERLDRARNVFRGAELISAPTTGPRTAGAIAAQCVADGADLVIAVGGDGTINEVMEGMNGSAIPLAILPGGTANVLANELGMSSSLELAAKSILNATPRRVSVGRVENSHGTRHFLLMAGIGLDAHIIYNLNLPLKARIGKGAYWLGGFGQFGRRLEEFEVSIDGRPRSCTFALITKVRNYGGDFEIARRVSLLDQDFEIVLFEGSSLHYAKYLIGMVAGRVSGMAGVSVFRAREISIAAAPHRRVHLQIDGEYAGGLPAKVGVVEDALTLLIPAAYPR